MIATGVLSISEMITKMDADKVPSQSTITVVQSQQATAPAGYMLLSALTEMSGKTYVDFTHPTQGNPILVNVGGTWKAFSSTCTHQPCTVGYNGGSTIDCPCHGSTFSVENGTVLVDLPLSPFPNMP
jgi:Rieske Fe-S protein